VDYRYKSKDRAWRGKREDRACMILRMPEVAGVGLVWEGKGGV